MGQSDTMTQGVRVEVESQYVPLRSDPAKGVYFFIYHVTISNEGNRAAKLVTRHWMITNAHGHTEHVRGPGVVGKTPRLQPGERFQYTSACPLPTPLGSMQGSFQMVRDDGEMFDAEIDVFSLVMPGALN